MTIALGMSYYKHLQVEIAHWTPAMQQQQQQHKKPLSTIYDAELCLFSDLQFNQNVFDYLINFEGVYRNMSEFSFFFAVHHFSLSMKCGNLYMLFNPAHRISFLQQDTSFYHHIYRKKTH
jgi:hypothetical protein